MSAIRHLMTVCVLSVVLAGCQEGDPDTAEADTALPEVLNPQRAACEEEGGRWGKIPNRETFTCFRITRDANKSCSTARDCEGACLARSQTCAPQMPLFGCHDILSSSGFRQTQCLE